MKKQNLPNITFLANFAMQTIFLTFLFVSNTFPQVTINERVEINPAKQKFDSRTPTEGDGWWIDTCYIDTYDSSEIDLTFTPSSIEPGETAIMTLWASVGYEYDEDDRNILEKTITLEPNYGTIQKIDSSHYKYFAPSSTPGDSVLIVTVNYENFNWICAYGDEEKGGHQSNNILEDLQCGCPLWTSTKIVRNYGSAQIVIDWDSLDVQVEPDTIYPGGTVQVVIKKRLPDGTLTDFPPEQTYEIAKLEGCLSGNIVVGQDSGAYFYDVSQPIYFAVADSLVGDSVGTVLLQVGLIVSSEKPRLGNKPNNIESNECFTGNFESESKDNTKVTINDVVTIGFTVGTYHINSVPEMPDNLSIWVHPNFFSGEPYFLDWDLEVKWVSTEQEPDKTFSYTFNDQTMGTSADGVGLTLPETDETIIGGDELTLAVRYTDNNFTDEEVTKKLTGMKILGTNGENNVQVVNDYIANHEFPEIDLDLSEEVTLQDQRKQMQIIVQLESSHFQFYDERYLWKPHGPNDVGYPNIQTNDDGVLDWGLCQIHEPEPPISWIWNWKININQGIHFLWTEKFEQMKRDGWDGGFYEIKERLLKKGIEVRNLNREDFLKWLSQRYKAGQYYINYVPGKKDKEGYWVPNPEHRARGDKFWMLFNQQ